MIVNHHMREEPGARLLLIFLPTPGWCQLELRRYGSIAPVGFRGLAGTCLPSPNGYLTPRKKRSASLFVRTPKCAKGRGRRPSVGDGSFLAAFGLFSKLFDDFNYANRRSDRIGCGSRSILHCDQDTKIREGNF